MSKVTDQVEEKIHNLVEYLTHRICTDGSITTDTDFSKIPAKFGLGGTSTKNMLKVYYNIVNGKLIPKVKGIRINEQKLLLEYRYQNTLLSRKRYTKENYQYAVVKNTKTNKLQVVEKDEICAHHIIVGRSITLPGAQKRWMELIKEQSPNLKS